MSVGHTTEKDFEAFIENHLVDNVYNPDFREKREYAKIVGNKNVKR